jgi:hypothetical protein
MLKDQADYVVAALSSIFKGQELETVTTGNQDARDADIPQQYRVRTYFGAAAHPHTALDLDQLADLMETARSASTEDEPIGVDLTPVDRGMLEIRAVLE